jgi:CopG family nickel-responsive transcriptional regulator
MSDLGETVRFSVSIDNELLRKFDEVIKEKKYENRSRAIRDLIRNLIVEREWERSAGEVMGALTLLYSHDTRGIMEKLLDIQHDRCSNIVSSMHLHLDEHNCMEIIAIKGTPQEVKEISDGLISCRGVKHGKLMMSSMGKEIA